MGKLFGTDGIRGVANKEPITSSMAVKIGQALSYVLKRDKHRPRIVIGKDTRLSGYMLESALVSGITSFGVDVILAGPIPTPGVAFLTSNMNADAGIVISASHNPYEDNGIKIFSRNGFKLSDEEELRIEELIFSNELDEMLAPSQELGNSRIEESSRGRYIVFLKHSFPKTDDLEGMKVVLDCANGATYKVAPILFSEMRADITAINTSPNGRNINYKCGALHPEYLAEKVLETGSNIGIAFDGDGDRFIAVDEKGNIVTGDQIIAIVAKHLKNKGLLKNNTVITTVMSNLGLSMALKDMGIEHLKTKVGDRYVLEEMLKRDAIIGGEDSGHIIFSEHHTTGDGILTALQLLSIMKQEKQPLSELSKVMKIFPQITINIEVKKKDPIDDIPEIKDAISEVEKELGGKGRVLVRYSGTQSVCRVMVEGPTESDTKNYAEKISEIVRKKLN